MKSVRFVSTTLLIAALFVAGCQAPTPHPATPVVQPTPTRLGATPTLAPAAPTEADLVARVLASVQSLGQTGGFTYELKETSFTRFRVTAGGETLNEGTDLTTMVDAGAWQPDGDQANLAVRRLLTYPGSNQHAVSGELRQVGGQMYARGAFDNPNPDLPAMPDGWLVVNGRSSLLYWQGFGELRFHEAFSDLRQAPWALLSGYPTQTLTDVLGHHLDSAGNEATTLPGGVPGEKLTLTIKSSALPQTIRYLGGSPADLRAISSVRGSPISMTFVLNEAGALVDWTLAIAFDVEGVDLTGTAGSPDGALLEGHFEQKVSAHLERAASPIAIAVPEADEMGQLPAYTGPERGALYASLDTFDEALNRAITGGTLDEFWQELAAARTMPLVFDDLAVFVFRGAAHSVTWDSDWQYQRATATDHLDDTDVWMHTVRLPLDARLEYGLQVDGHAAELDPLNPNVETGGLGSKSVVEMPGYAAPAYAVPRAGVAAGTLTEAVPVASEHLGYAVNYRVYTPANYPQLAGLPALYVTDGQDFLAFGKLDVVLDNLIADGRIEPVMAVFIDPRDVVTQENRRNEQFFDNPQYGQFIAEELVPEIDRRYRTDPSPDARLIIGTSNGGYFTPYFALSHADVFHFVTAFSPSLWHNPALIETYREADVLPLRFFISTGVFNDSDYYARQFADMLQDKGYPTVYLESNESHSYGNWRGKFDHMLEFFFPADAISGAH